jgi:hypothetical protein
VDLCGLSQTSAGGVQSLVERLQRAGFLALVKRTALMYAAIGDQIEVFKLLLSKGADPRIRNSKSVYAVEFSPAFKQCEYEALVDLYAWEQYKTKAK